MSPSATPWTASRSRERAARSGSPSPNSVRLSRAAFAASLLAWTMHPAGRAASDSACSARARAGPPPPTSPELSEAGPGRPSGARHTSTSQAPPQASTRASDPRRPPRPIQRHTEVGVVTEVGTAKQPARHREDPAPPARRGMCSSAHVVCVRPCTRRLHQPRLRVGPDRLQHAKRPPSTTDERTIDQSRQGVAHISHVRGMLVAASRRPAAPKHRQPPQ